MPVNCLNNAEKFLEWLEMEGNGWKWLEIDGNDWKWMEMDGMAGNGHSYVFI